MLSQGVPGTPRLPKAGERKSFSWLFSPQIEWPSQASPLSGDTPRHQVTTASRKTVWKIQMRQIIDAQLLWSHWRVWAEFVVVWGTSSPQTSQCQLLVTFSGPGSTRGQIQDRQMWFLISQLCLASSRMVWEDIGWLRMEGTLRMI